VLKMMFMFLAFVVVISLIAWFVPVVLAVWACVAGLLTRGETGAIIAVWAVISALIMFT
jgi:hypothetical protein